ncbi:MAG: DNA polymerase III subunit delta [Butyrivibrio sp.]|jgi:DNA polymerase-3 subunit delta'|nr:DNA polymerase III subunit delta [Butyrivibrio sp.]
MARFADIIDQTQMKDHLQNALRTGKVSHAYIIAGEKESGKEFIAGIFAKTLQCEDRRETGEYMEACDQCHSCIQAEHMDHPDIITVTHEKPGSIGVDEIRAQVRDDVQIKPYSGKYKIYIIPEGEKMTASAQNALLKTLEEPPAYVVIIILTENTEAFLPTIISRCIVLPMKPASDDSVRKFLMEQIKIVDYKADLCVAFARGNVGKAIQLAQNEEFEELRNQTISLVQNLGRKEIFEINNTVHEIITAQEQDRKQDFLDVLTFWFRDVLVCKATEEDDHLIFRDKISYIRDTADRCSYEGLNRIIEAMRKARKRLDANVNADLALEMLMIAVKENL